MHAFTTHKRNVINRTRLFAALFDPRRVMFEQMEPLLQSGTSSLFANGVVALIIAAVVNSPEQRDVAFHWAAACLAVVLASGLVLRVVKRSFNTQHHLLTASWMLTVASALRGMIWGLGFVLLMPRADSYEQVMLGWAIAGLMCGGAFSSWSHPAAAMSFAGMAGVGGFIGMSGVPEVGETWMPYAVPVLFLFLLRAVHVSVSVFRKSVMAEKELASKNGVIGLLLKDFEENASDWLWEADARGMLKRGADRFARVLEQPVDKLVHRSLPMLTEIYGLSDAGNTLFRARFMAREAFTDHVLSFMAGGLERFIKITAKPLMALDGTLAGWHGVASDVTDERLVDMKVRKMALFDTLTDLPNRSFFHDRLDDVQNGNHDVACWVMYLDLDGFKAVNDTCGHAAGDQLLRAVSSRLSSCLPAKGMLARLGGDEFAVICMGGRQRAENFAQKFVDALELPFIIGSHDINIGVSIGIAELVRDLQGRDEWMRRADVALYAAKHHGRGHARFYDADMDRAQLRKRHIAQALRKALALDGLVLHYQPIVDLKSGKVHAYEALLRLTATDLGPISPADFIPVAEETGLIADIGAWVINKACSDAVRWPNDVCVAVNVSPLQLKSHRILSVVTEALATSGLLPHRLELELTETALIENVEHTTRILADLKALGVQLALDDFGTGYSSLAHLHQFNFDKIKIDRSFVQTFGDRRESTAVVNAVAHLARDLGITMTAEGVETKEHMAAMQELGIDHVQGYLLGRPEPQKVETHIQTPKSA